MIDHSSLSTKLTISIDIITTSPLHIGSGENEGKLSDPQKVIRYQKSIGDEILEQPYIPASSLKGVLRNTIETYINQADIDHYACDPLTNDHCGSSLKPNEIQSSSYEITERKQKQSSTLCIVCIMFGSQVSKGLLSIENFYPEDKIKLFTKTSTAISRLNGTVQRGALFTTEYVGKNEQFTGAINLYNPKNETLKLLGKAFKMLNLELIYLGAFKSKGFGRIKISINRVHSINLTDLSVTEHFTDLDKSQIIANLERGEIT